jgi:hypothetical protein
MLISCETVMKREIRIYRKLQVPLKMVPPLDFLSKATAQAAAASQE